MLFNFLKRAPLFSPRNSSPARRKIPILWCRPAAPFLLVGKGGNHIFPQEPVVRRLGGGGWGLYWPVVLVEENLWFWSGWFLGSQYHIGYLLLDLGVKEPETRDQKPSGSYSNYYGTTRYHIETCHWDCIMRSIWVHSTLRLNYHVLSQQQILDLDFFFIRRTRLVLWIIPNFF